MMNNRTLTDALAPYTATRRPTRRDHYTAALGVRVALARAIATLPNPRRKTRCRH